MDFSPYRELETGSTPAFVLYKPLSKGAEESIFCNKEAWKIISLLPPSSEKPDGPSRNLSLLCSKWHDLFKKRGGYSDDAEAGDDAKSNYIDVFRSGRRQYTVKGALLSQNKTVSRDHEKYFIFIIERIRPDKINFPLIFRRWKMTEREKEIVKLILEDKSNKEIANSLGLSQNTIKLYLKILMRKLGVASRAGIVSLILTKEEPTSPSLP